MLSKNRLELNYIRIDNKNVDSVLKNFLDEFYPISEHRVSNFAIPKHG